MPESTLTIDHGMTIADLKKRLAAFPDAATISISSQILVENVQGPNQVVVKVEIK